MKVNETIEARRKEFGLTERDVSSIASLNAEAYGDIELYEDEAFSVVQLYTMRAICEALKLDLLALFEIDRPPLAHARSEEKPWSRNDLIARRRIELGLSREELAERIGFYPIAVERMENDPDFLEEWSVELVQRLAAALQIPVHALLQP